MPAARCRRPALRPAFLIAAVVFVAGLALPASAVEFGLGISITPSLAYIRRSDIPLNEQRWASAHCDGLSELVDYGRNVDENGFTVPPHLVIIPTPLRVALTRSFPLQFLTLDDCIRMGFVDK